MIYYRIVTILTVVVMIGTGCTKAVKYDFTDLNITPPNSARQSMKVAIMPFEDLRSRKGTKPSGGLGKMEIQDRMVEGGNVPRSINNALAEHFNHVQLFKTVETLEESDTSISPDVIKKIRDLGYDAFITGKIKRFYGAGYATTFDKVAAPLAFIPITIVVTIPIMMLQNNHNEGHVELIDIQLTETKTGKALWSGSFAKKTEKQYYVVDPVRVASDTLKEVAIEMASQIQNWNRCQSLNCE